MMKRILFFLFLSALSLSCLGQNWEYGKTTWVTAVVGSHSNFEGYSTGICFGEINMLDPFVYYAEAKSGDTDADGDGASQHAGRYSAQWVNGPTATKHFLSDGSFVLVREGELLGDFTPYQYNASKSLWWLNPKKTAYGIRAYFIQTEFDTFLDTIHGGG